MKKINQIKNCFLLFFIFQSSLSFAISIPNSFSDAPVFAPTLRPMAKIAIPYLPISITTSNAVNDFKNLTKVEKKGRIKEAKSLLANYKKQKKAGDDISSNQVLMAILCVLLPPLAVYLHENDTNTKFWISLVLSLLLWIPGIVYALLVVFGNA